MEPATAGMAENGIQGRESRKDSFTTRFSAAESVMSVAK